MTVTNNGFALVPTFTLGKPALISTFYIGGKGRFSFEPQFRYALEFKPWSFIFIWRYKLIRKEKFEMKLGTHLPALSYRTIDANHDGEEKSVVQARRFFPVIEIIPVWSVSEKFSLSGFCLYGRGIEKDLPKNGLFIASQANFKHLTLHGKWHLSGNVQFYFLWQEGAQGWYVAPFIAIGREGFPIAISSAMNKAIDSQIDGKDFEWNVGLTWHFQRNYRAL